MHDLCMFITGSRDGNMLQRCVLARQDGSEAHSYWVAWRCADGSDVQRWYNLPPMEALISLCLVTVCLPEFHD